MGDPEKVNVWRKYTTNEEFHRIVYDGDHFYFERNIEDITSIIGKIANKIIEKM